MSNQENTTYEVALEKSKKLEEEIIANPVLQIAKRSTKLFSKHQKEPPRLNIWFGVLVVSQIGNIKVYAVS